MVMSVMVRNTATCIAKKTCCYYCMYGCADEGVVVARQSYLSGYCLTAVGLLLLVREYRNTATDLRLRILLAASCDFEVVFNTWRVMMMV